MKPVNKKKPYFPFYPYDFLTDDKVIGLSNEQVGIYIKMLCHQWIHGPLSSDKVVICRLCGVTDLEKSGILQVIETCFAITEDGKLFNHRLELIRDELEGRLERLSMGGTKGMENRWGKKPVKGDKVVITSDNIKLNKIKLEIHNQVVEVINYLNKATHKKFSITSKANLMLVKARLAEGRSVADCKQVIDTKVAEWATNKDMAKFLRPETLFNATKFDSYINQDPPKAKEEPKTWEQTIAEAPKK